VVARGRVVSGAHTVWASAGVALGSGDRDDLTGRGAAGDVMRPLLTVRGNDSNRRQKESEPITKGTGHRVLHDVAQPPWNRTG
jgi:hypothetical protein